MMLHWSGPSPWWWCLMAVGMLLFWAVVGWVVVHTHPTTGATAPHRLDARETLEERFARGEIDAEEYRARLEVLQGGAGRRAA